MNKIKNLLQSIINLWNRLIPGRYAKYYGYPEGKIKFSTINNIKTVEYTTPILSPFTTPSGQLAFRANRDCIMTGTDYSGRPDRKYTMKRGEALTLEQICAYNTQNDPSQLSKHTSSYSPTNNNQNSLESK